MGRNYSLLDCSIYILTANHDEAIIRADEDPMPLDGNPHLMPGKILLQPFWAMPPYPTLSWNVVPPGHHPEQNLNANGWGNPQDNNATEDQGPRDDNGWGVWDDAVAQQNANQNGNEPAQEDPIQDQSSMVLNPSLGSNSSVLQQEDQDEVQ